MLEPSSSGEVAMATAMTWLWPRLYQGKYVERGKRVRGEERHFTARDPGERELYCVFIAPCIIVNNTSTDIFIPRS